MVSARDGEKKDDVSFGHGADRRLAQAVLDAAHAASRATDGSARAKMLEGLRTAAAGVAAALATTRTKAPSRRTTTALLVACGGLEQAIRAVVPPTRRAARPVPPGRRGAGESAA